MSDMDRFFIKLRSQSVEKTDSDIFGCTRCGRESSCIYSFNPLTPRTITPLSRGFFFCLGIYGGFKLQIGLLKTQATPDSTCEIMVFVSVVIS